MIETYLLRMRRHYIYFHKDNLCNIKHPDDYCLKRKTMIPGGKHTNKQCVIVLNENLFTVIPGIYPIVFFSFLKARSIAFV